MTRDPEPEVSVWQRIPWPMRDCQISDNHTRDQRFQELHVAQRNCFEDSRHEVSIEAIDVGPQSRRSAVCQEAVDVTGLYESQEGRIVVAANEVSNTGVAETEAVVDDHAALRSSVDVISYKDVLADVWRERRDQSLQILMAAVHVSNYGNFRDSTHSSTFGICV